MRDFVDINNLSTMPLLPPAPNQPAYQRTIENLILRWAASQFTVWEIIAEVHALLGVRIVWAIEFKSRNNIVVTTSSPHQVMAQARHIETRLATFLVPEKLRTTLVDVPEADWTQFKSDKILVSRFGRQSGDPLWMTAVILSGRNTPPFETGTAPTLTTLDYGVVEFLADRFATEVRGGFRLPISRPEQVEFANEAAGIRLISKKRRGCWIDHPLSRHRGRSPWRFMDRRFERLGQEVVVSHSRESVSISRLEVCSDLGRHSLLGMGEECVRAIFGDSVFNLVSLKEKDPSHRERRPKLPEVREFRIMHAQYPVFGRWITVEVLPGRVHAEVTIPLGWWWDHEPEAVKVKPGRAQAQALSEESEREPEATGLEANFVETVVWPEEPKGRLAHIIRVRSELGVAAEYFINAHDASVIERRDLIRS